MDRVQIICNATLSDTVVTCTLESATLLTPSEIITMPVTGLTNECACREL
ncbi:MAG: hypothetical protein ACLU80_11210 [Dorea sp.]